MLTLKEKKFLFVSKEEYLKKEKAKYNYFASRYLRAFKKKSLSREDKVRVREAVDKSFRKEITEKNLANARKAAAKLLREKTEKKTGMSWAAILKQQPSIEKKELEDERRKKRDLQKKNVELQKRFDDLSKQFASLSASLEELKAKIGGKPLDQSDFGTTPEFQQKKNRFLRKSSFVTATGAVEKFLPCPIDEVVKKIEGEISPKDRFYLAAKIHRLKLNDVVAEEMKKRSYVSSNVISFKYVVPYECVVLKSSK